MKEALQNLWIEARQEIVAQWAEELLNALGRVKVVVPPRPALIMMQARDSIEDETLLPWRASHYRMPDSVPQTTLLGKSAGGTSPVRSLALALLAASQALTPESVDGMEPVFSGNGPSSIDEDFKLPKPLALHGTVRNHEHVKPENPMSLFQIDPLTMITQRCYRSILGALSRPGVLQNVDAWNASHLRELSFSQAPLPLVALTHTLMDEQVTLAVCGNEADSWSKEFAAATGCRKHN